MSSLISIIVPVYNEQDSLALLLEKITQVMASRTQESFELIFIDSYIESVISPASSTSFTISNIGRTSSLAILIN